MEALEVFNAGWWSILPPVTAILLALITKEVISSLILGILAGAFIYSKGHMIGMVSTTFGIMGDKIGGNVNILIFLGLLGALVVIVTKANGSIAYGNWAAQRIKTRGGACLATSALGCVIFIDDYFNCLSVGTVMRPVTDKYRVSRAKLAYILDSTAAPICILVPISSWGASVATYMQDAGLSGMQAFISTIPYNFYAILTIIMVIIVCVSKINFGPMLKFEKNAIENGDLFSREDELNTADQTMNQSGKSGKVYDLVIPILSLIVVTVLAMMYTGGFFEGSISLAGSFGACDSSLSLVMGSFGALVVTFLLLIPRGVITFEDYTNGIVEGIKSMVPSFVILILAWTISGVCSTEYLNTGGFVGGLVNKASFPVFVLPLILFVVAGFLGFATGTSWGTMALLIPIGVAVCATAQTSHLIYPVLGSILGGAVYGDHISPISDTTILSSTGAGCNHIDHVTTQLSYASLVAVSASIGYLIMGLLNQFLLPLILSVSVLVISIYCLNRYYALKQPIDYSQVKYK